MRTLTIREAAGAAVRAMEAVDRTVLCLDKGGLEALASLRNARYILADALARDDEAHALAMLKAMGGGKGRP